MKKINIIDDFEDKPIVDDDLLLEHNQNSSEENKTQEIEIKEDFSMKKPTKLFIIIIVISVLAGVGTGFGSFKLFAKPASSEVINGQEVQEQPTAGQIKVGDVFGSTNESFKDPAEGYLEEGGIDGEGSHKLLRPGGESQTVYLTSSVVDLDKLVGMEVKIWGETFKSQKAGWLMDVGRVEVLNTQAESPAEE